MRNSSKILCVALALVMILSLAACSLTPQNSYSTDDVELPIGVYIYNVYSAYNQAQNYAQQSDLYDSEAGTYDGKKSFLKLEITDDDGVTATADEWIKDKADEYTRNILAIYHEYNELGCTMDEATVEGYESQAKEYWDYGPYYQYYGEQYLSPYSEIFEPLGVGYDSFYIASFYTSAMQNEVFSALYEKDGKEAVSDEELTKYFTDNYTSYKYFSVNLYTTESEATTDEEGNETTEDVNVALSEEEVQGYQNELDIYKNAVASGSSYDDIISQYMSAHSIESDPTQSGVSILSEASLGEEITAELEKLSEGEASVITVGDDDTTKVMYFIYKEPIDNQIEAYIGDETERDTVLHNMKDDDFEKHLKEVADSLDVTVNSACGGYTPSFIENRTKKSSK